MTQHNFILRPVAAETLPPAAIQDFLLTHAERADYEATRLALLESMRPGTAITDLTQPRIIPHPESDFGRYCLQMVAGLHQIQTPELNSRLALAGSTTGHWFIDTDDTIKVLHEDAPPTPVIDSGLKPSVLRQCRQQNETLEEPARTDGSVSLALMLRCNYGMSLPESPDTASVTSLLEALAEVRATQELGLLDPNGIATLLGAQNVWDMRQVCADYLGTGGGSLLGRLGAAVLASRTALQIRTSPVTLLTQVIRSEEAQSLAKAILKKWEWSESEPLEPLFTLTDRVLWHAISVDIQSPENLQLGHFAGYEIARPDNWGRSHADILVDIHRHMIATGKASSLNEAALATFVVAFNHHPEWLISDIPDDLPYASSEVWVNVQHGVKLAEILELGSSRWINFQDLTNLPAVFSKTMETEEQQMAYAVTRIPALLTWAQANGHLRLQADRLYSIKEVEQVTSAFERAEDEILQAIDTLAKPAPERRAMALANIESATRTPEIAAQLEEAGYRHLPMPLSPNLVLVPKSYPPVYRDPHGTYSLSHLSYDAYGIKHEAFSILDVYMSGEKIEDWRAPGNPHDGNLSHVLFEVTLLYNAMPPMPESYNDSFQRYLSNARLAYATLIRKMLVRLPFKHRVAIENGEVTLLSLRLPTQDIRAASENESHREPLRGRAGFIIKATYLNTTTYYEVFPLRMIIRHRPDLITLPEGGLLTTVPWGRIPIPSSWIDAEGRPSQHNSVEISAGRKLAFDQDAYLKGREPRAGAAATLIAEVIGIRFPAPITATDDKAPLAAFSERCMAIGHSISHNLFYVNTDVLYDQCNEVTTVERYNGKPTARAIIGNFLLAMTPWHEIQEILSGERLRMRGGMLGLLFYSLPFIGPIGKLTTGVARLVKGAGKATLVARSGTATSSTLTASMMAWVKGAIPSKELAVKIGMGVSNYASSQLKWKSLGLRASVAASRRLVIYTHEFDAQIERREVIQKTLLRGLPANTAPEDHRASEAKAAG